MIAIWRAPSKTLSRWLSSIGSCPERMLHATGKQKGTRIKPRSKSANVDDQQSLTDSWDLWPMTLLSIRTECREGTGGCRVSWCRFLWQICLPETVYGQNKLKRGERPWRFVRLRQMEFRFLSISPKTPNLDNEAISNEHNARWMHTFQ